MKKYKEFYQKPYKRVIDQSDSFDRFETMSEEDKRYIVFAKKECVRQIVDQCKVDGPVLSWCRYAVEYKYGCGRFYKKSRITGSIWVNRETKKVITQASNCDSEMYYNTNQYFSIYQILCAIEDFEFVTRLPRKILTKGVIKNILLGKITSPEQAMKYYLKSIKCGDYPWRACMNYMLKSNALSISTLKEVLENPISFLESNTELLWAFRDMVSQAYALGTKINHRWSSSRARSVHEEWTRILMNKELSLKDKTSIWDEDIVDEFKAMHLEVINDEQRAFEESQYMHHCLYDCYWKKMKGKLYLGLSTTITGERVTIGIDLNNPTEIQQMHTIRNGWVNEHDSSIIEGLILALEPVLKKMKAETTNRFSDPF